MYTRRSSQSKTERTFAVVMVVSGLGCILGAPLLIWGLREALAETGPRALLSLKYGLGGLLLLYLTAGVPLGALMLAMGGVRLYADDRARHVLVPLLGIQVVFFTFHAVRLLQDWTIPFLVFAATGFLFIALFIALVWMWARKRPTLDPARQRVADFQVGAGLSFFAAAWQTCGLVGAPGFALYPEIVQRLGNQAFVAGQAFAIHIFLILGFIFLFLAMRVDQSHHRATNYQDGTHSRES